MVGVLGRIALLLIALQLFNWAAGYKSGDFEPVVLEVTK